MNSPSHDPSAFGFSPRLLLGLGLALFGVILLLGRLDMFDANYVLRFWPLVLVAIGLQQFFNPRVGSPAGRLVPVNGVIWIVIGGLLLLNSFGILRVSIWELFWPAVLIALGVRLMTRQGLRGLGHGPRSTAEFTSSDIGPLFAVLSGVKRISAPQPFHGTEVTTFMGGALLDLRQAILSPPTVIEQATASGGPAPRLVIRGFVMMGGVTIRS